MARNDQLWCLLQIIAKHVELHRCFVNFMLMLWDHCLITSELVDTCSTMVADAAKRVAVAATAAAGQQGR